MNLTNRNLDQWYDKFSLLRHPGFKTNGQQTNPLKQIASRLQNQEHSSLNTRSTTLNNRAIDSQTTTVKDGNQTRTNTTQAIVDTVDISTQKQLSVQSEQVVEQRVNGKDTYARNLRDTEQSTNEKRQTSTSNDRTATSNTTRDVAKNGNQTRTLTHTDNLSDQQTTSNSVYDKQTDTENRFKTYDKSGKLVSDKFSHQVVTTEQTSAATRNTHNEGTRDIEQNSNVVQLKEGNNSIRKVNTDTSDVTKNQQVINGQTSTRTETSVQNLDEQGQSLSARAYSQQVDSTENRVIDSERAVDTEQESRTTSRTNQTDSDTSTHTQVRGEVHDESLVQTTVRSYDQDGNLTAERNSTRQVDTTSTEERDLINNSSYKLQKNNGNGITQEKSEIDAREAYSLQTRTFVDQDGTKTERQIITQGEVNTWGEIDNKLEADGDRHLNLIAGQNRDIITSDQTISANNQAKNVTTTTWSDQMVEGDIDFDATGNSSAVAAPGRIVIDIGSNTGLRASFKMDDGILKFDFSAQRLDATQQTSVSSTGPMTPISNKESLDDLHFTGQVISSVDAAGNRVLTFEARVIDDQDAMMATGTSLQSENRDTEYEISGSLKVNRDQSQDGSTTSTKVSSNAELNINKVETMEADGYNLRNLTALTNADAVKAGFVSSSNAIRFNFGSFNVGISFQA